MSDLTPDEVQRLEKVLCTTHSEVLFTAGVPVSEVAAWARGHGDCELTVVLAEQRTMNPFDIARELRAADERSG